MDRRILNSAEFRRSGAAILVVLGLYCLLGRGWGVEKITLQQGMSDKASGQIDEALEKNLVVFATISAIKAAAAVIEGSSLGVGFDLELGDLVQPAYDYIDFVWTLFLYAVLILTFYKLLVECGILGIGLQILGSGLILWGLGVVSSARKERLQSWARRLVLLGLLVAYGVPAVLLSSHFLSARYTSPLKEQTAAKIASAEQDVARAKKDFFSLRDKVSLARPGESLENIRASVLEVVERVTSVAWRSLKTMLFYVSILLFELLLLPILMALLIYTLLHLTLGKVPLPGRRL